VPATGGPASMGASWDKMKGAITEKGLRRNPDMVEAAMDMVFGIERQANMDCGPPSGTDMALLLIAKLHEGN
jgi:hypothetical protein